MNHCAISLRRQRLPLKYHPAHRNFLVNSFFFFFLWYFNVLMHGCRLSQPCWDCWRGSCWHLIPRTISGARKIGFFPPLRTYITSRNKLGLQAEKAANSADLGQGWGYLSCPLSSPGLLPCSGTSTHMICPCSVTPPTPGDCCNVIYASKPSKFFFLIQLRCDILGPGE